MIWLSDVEAHVVDGLVSVRALHFVSTVLLAGSLLYWGCIGAPVLAHAQPRPEWSERWRGQLQVLNWSSLVAVVGTGALWLVLVAGQITDGSWQSAFGDGTLRIILRDTQFGHVFSVRAALAGALVVMLSWKSAAWPRAATVVVAMTLLAALAWTGHAGASIGGSGTFHLAADAVHLLAAGAWIGGLPPLWMTMRYLRRANTGDTVAIARAVLHRFSKLGLVSVGALLASGAVNSWFLVGGPKGLVGTAYGQWLMLKLVLFCGMLGLAAINRFRIMEQLDAGMAAQDQVLRRLRANTLAEICLGIAILLIVALLGTLPPAAHSHG